MRLKFTGWETLVAALAGVSAGYAMPNAFYGDGAAEIVTVLGFLIAALVPAMALGATALRAGGFSVMRIQALGGALDEQIRVFAGLFLYSLAACVLAILGELVKWTVPTIPLGWANLAPLDLSFLFPASLTFLFVFLTLRSMAFIAGILSIFKADHEHRRGRGPGTGSRAHLCGRRRARGLRDASRLRFPGRATTLVSSR